MVQQISYEAYFVSEPSILAARRGHLLSSAFFLHPVLCSFSNSYSPRTLDVETHLLSSGLVATWLFRQHFILAAYNIQHKLRHCWSCERDGKVISKIMPHTLTPASNDTNEAVD